MARQGSYPIGNRILAATDTATGVVTGATADIPLAALATFIVNSPPGISLGQLIDVSLIQQVVWDPLFKANSITLSNGNLEATFSASQGVVLADSGELSGRYYFEVQFVSGTASTNAAVGVVPQTENLESQIGFNDGPGSCGTFQESGNIFVNGGTAAGSASSFANPGNVVGVALDATNRLIWFREGAGNWNGSGTANPAADVGGVLIGGTAAFFPALCSNAASSWLANFAGPFATAAPAGFGVWPSSQVTDGEVLTFSEIQDKWIAAPVGGVTSVNVAGGATGLTFIGGPITDSGTITATGVVAVQSGGTGLGTLSNNAVILGNGTASVQAAAPGTVGQMLLSTGATSAPAFGSAPAIVGGSITNTPVSATIITVSGTITPSQTAGIVGTTTNNNANAGSVGEYLTGTVALGTTIASGVPTTCASVSLTAGDWDVSGVVTFNPSGTASVGAVLAGISTTAATFGAPNTGTESELVTALGVGGAYALATPVVRVSLAASGTAFLIGQLNFTNTATFGGFIRARRIR